MKKHGVFYKKPPRRSKRNFAFIFCLSFRLNDRQLSSQERWLVSKREWTQNDRTIFIAESLLQLRGGYTLLFCQYSVSRSCYTTVTFEPIEIYFCILLYFDSIFYRTFISKRKKKKEKNFLRSIFSSFSSKNYRFFLDKES
jgi:hypothetical protein